MAIVHMILTDEASSVARVRRVVDRVAKAHGLSPEASFDLKLAASEAVANALRHGSEGELAVGVALDRLDDAIEVEVQDHGNFNPEPVDDPERGRGIPLMLALADEVEFTSTEAGTRVRIRKRIDPDDGAAAYPDL